MKKHQMFSVNTTPEKFENAAIADHVAFVLSKTRVGEYHDYLDVIVFGKHRFQNVFRPTKTRSRRF